ncbi:MAG: DUF2063 domain-containing protein [Betaproteobacteria bacterium HGW-Betaproteobacteria-15]|nr:MAG: DUF2063 domain-containing protein [Betaproteobacteria bacterium HGW-Betaproteobacteria-15]
MSAQHTWAQALLDPSLAVPQGLSTWNHSDPAKRLAVYRNNVMVSLVDALAQTFPVTLQLVGEEFFRAMAQVFVRAHPPRTRVLAHHGQALPGFIAQFLPAAGLPYLPDVAQLEWQRLQSLHAADASAVEPSTIAALLADAERLPLLRWQPHPSLQLLRSPHAVVSLWAAHQPGSVIALESVQVAQPEAALVFRSGLDVMVLQTDAGLTALTASLLDNVAFGTAINQALSADPAFDPSQAMAVLIRHGLLIGARHPH